MTPTSSKHLQALVDNINSDISKLLEVAAGNGYGIVSNHLEFLTPENLSVSWDAEATRVRVTPGDFVTPTGQFGRMIGSIDDLVWPDEPVVYVVVHGTSEAATAPSEYGGSELAITRPGFFLDLVLPQDLEQFSQNGLVLAVLRKSDEIDEVDTTNLNFKGNRSTFGVLDHEHRSKTKYAPSPENPHGLGIDQLQGNGISLLRQIHDIGFVAAASPEIPGMPGRAVRVRIQGQAQVSSTGKLVPPGNYYLVLDSFPLQMPKVTEAGVDIPCTWEPGSNIIDFGTSDPGDFDLEYFQMSDLEAHGSDAGTITRFRGTEEAVAVSDGKLLELPAGSVDLSQYKGIALQVDVLATSRGLATAPAILGTFEPTRSKSVTGQFPLTLEEPGQISFGVVGAGLDGQLAPPAGRVYVRSSNCVGKYRFMYTLTAPAYNRLLEFTDTGFGSWSAGIGDSGKGVLFAGEKPVRRRYYNIVGETLYLEARAYDKRASYSFRGSKFESKRYQRGYVDVIGTRPKPDGVAATASIKFVSSFSSADSITLRFGSSNPDVLKVHGLDFTGTTALECAASLVLALNNDPLFAEYCTAFATSSTVKITAKALGATGNAYTISVNAVNGSSKVSVKPFSGGSSYMPTKADMVGAVLEIRQPYQDFPPGTSLCLYTTLDLEDKGVESQYHKLTEFGLVPSMSTYTVNVTEAVADGRSDAVGYDTEKELNVTLQVRGVDPEGSLVQDSVILSDCSIHEPDEFGSNIQFQTTKSVYATVNGIVVTDDKNLGAGKVVVLGQALSRNSSKTRIAEITTDREAVIRVRDARSSIPAALANVPASQGDALMFSAALRNA